MRAKAGGGVNHWPLVLPHSDVRRILERHATALVATSRPKRGGYIVQDALTVRRNERMRRSGRSDQQQDPDVFAVEVTESAPRALSDVDYSMVRACGFKTQRDFFDDWLERRRAIDPHQDVFVVRFRLVDQPRFLHHKIHRGYTTNPGAAARGEPEALSADELNQLASRNRARLERERRDELCRQQARSISLRLRHAAKEGRPDEVLALRSELERLAARMSPVQGGVA